MSFKIYGYKSITPRAIVDLTDDSQKQVGLMREDILSLNFSVTAPIPFKIGDYTYFLNNQLYQINRLPTRTRNYSRSITYALQMEAEFYDLGKVQFLALDENNNFTEGAFPLRARAQDIATLIIYNMKRVFPLAEWKLGKIIETDYLEFEYKAQNCLQVLQDVAEKFSTEYFFDGKIINIYQRQTSSGIQLLTGQDNLMLNFTESQKDTSNPITRLFAYGSNKNIPSDYRGGAKYLRMADNIFIETDERERIFEYTKYFDGTDGTQEIYPHRTGVVSKVDDPFNFYDDAINFNVLAYLLPAISAKVTFNTGLLSGYTFDIAENGFDPVTKRFTILKNTSETTYDVPSVTLTPAIGDTYVITDIKMPQEYVDKAEADLKQVAIDWLAMNSEPSVAFSINPNGLSFKSSSINLAIGDAIQIIDNEMNISKITRVTAYNRNINNIYLYSGVQLGDTVSPKSTLVKLLSV